MIKKLLRDLFPSLLLLRNRAYNKFVHARFKGKSAEEVFQTIFQENHWRDKESKSGTGSNEKNSGNVVKIVSSAIRELQVKSMLDLPCGDFNWMKKVDLDNLTYLGADIVKPLIDSNIQMYTTPTIKFTVLNILEDHLPKVDLVFTRDCLVHFSYHDIAKTIDAIKRSGSFYWMTTTFPKHNNYNIVTGDWRPVNLEVKPFHLPPPLHIYNEAFSEDSRFADKSLAIWRIADL